MDRCSPTRPVAAALLALAVSGAAPQPESGYLARFSGKWSGAGVFQPNVRIGPQPVRCTLTGRSTEDRLTIAGSCRAHLIFTRAVSAEIAYDPSSRRYAGTYVGARVGPASVAGRREGDEINLTVRWPRPVNGDTTAEMRISNDGAGNLRIVVVDDYGKGETTVTDVALKRS